MRRWFAGASIPSPASDDDVGARLADKHGLYRVVGGRSWSN
jgi:hypothetical protein